MSLCCPFGCKSGDRPISPGLTLLITAGAALFAGLLLTPLVRALALKAGFVDAPGERKIHSAPIAYGGGFAVALAFAAGVAVAIFFLNANSPASPNDPRGWQVCGPALGALGALLLGFIDDKIKLAPLTKLIGQTVLAILAVASGVRITALIGDTLVMQAVTVAWIVLITNSFNLLDNMDGLCAGAAAIAAGVLSFIAYESNQPLLAVTLAALCGALLGFLKYNTAPATIFLGDAGSLFIGYTLACATVLVTYYHYQEPSHLAVGLPVLVLAIPLYDTCSVILIRLREGRPVMRGDTSHFSHRLVNLGMSRRQAVFTIHLACLAIGLPAIVIGRVSPFHGWLIVAQALLVVTLIAVLENAGRKRAED